MSTPIREDERILRVLVLDGFTPIEAFECMREAGCPPPQNRFCAIVRKWIAKGWMECGVSERTGWLTPKGRQAWESK